MAANSNFVLHITTVHPRYDIRILKKQCVSLKQAGYDVRLAVADGLGNETSNGIPIIDVGKPGGRLSRMIIFPWRAIALARRLKPSVVHIHDPEFLPAAFVLKILGFIVVYDAHEDLPRSIRSRRWLPSGLLGIASFAVQIAENTLARTVSAVVAATPHIAARFARLNRNVISVRNYPDMSLVPAEIPREPEPDTFCYVGGLSVHRGILEMVRATGLANTKLILAGPFGDEKLEAEVSRLPEWKNVQYLGIVPYKDVWRIMSRSHAGLLFLHQVPNYVDSLPVKLFEYMVAGIPVLASDYSGWPDIVKETQIGLTGDPANPQAIADMMRRILDDPATAREMGSKAREEVRSRYTWQGEADKLLDFYRRLVPSDFP